MKSFVLQGCAHPTLSLSSLPSSLLTINMVLLRQLFSTEHWSIDGTADLGTFYVRTCIRRAAASRKGSAPWPTGNYNWWLAQTYHSRSHFLIYPVHDRKNQPRELVLRTRLLGLLHLDPCCLLSTGSLAAAAAGNLLTTKLVAWIVPNLVFTSTTRSTISLTPTPLNCPVLLYITNSSGHCCALHRQHKTPRSNTSLSKDSASNQQTSSSQWR